jgi:hypothetical protein
MVIGYQWVYFQMFCQPHCSQITTRMLTLPISNCKDCGGKYNYYINMGVGSQHYELQLGELKSDINQTKC